MPGQHSVPRRGLFFRDAVLREGPDDFFRGRSGLSRQARQAS